MDEEEKRNYLMNIIKSTPFLVQDKIYRNDRKLNTRTDFNRIKKYIDDFLEKHNDDKL